MAILDVSRVAQNVLTVLIIFGLGYMIWYNLKNKGKKTILSNLGDTTSTLGRIKGGPL